MPLQLSLEVTETQEQVRRSKGRSCYMTVGGFHVLYDTGSSFLSQFDKRNNEDVRWGENKMKAYTTSLLDTLSNWYKMGKMEWNQ